MGVDICKADSVGTQIRLLPDHVITGLVFTFATPFSLFKISELHHDHVYIRWPLSLLDRVFKMSLGHCSLSVISVTIIAFIATGSLRLRV